MFSEGSFEKVFYYSVDAESQSYEGDEKRKGNADT
jgi:hypothetical protein